MNFALSKGVEGEFADDDEGVLPGTGYGPELESQSRSGEGRTRAMVAVVVSSGDWHHYGLLFVGGPRRVWVWKTGDGDGDVHGRDLSTGICLQSRWYA